MKASQFSDAQKAVVIKQGADGVPVAEICRKAPFDAADPAGALTVSFGPIRHQCC